MKIEPATPEDVRHVAARMRDSDLREFLAFSAVDTRTDLVENLVCRFGPHRGDVLAFHLDEPVAIGGVIEIRPRVITLLFFASDRFPEMGLEATRWVKQRLFAGLKAGGVHRIEAVSIDGHTAAHRWIEALGLRREGTFRGFGKNGETFHQFAWVSDACPTSA